MGLVDNLIAQFQAQQEKANLANELRYRQGLDIFDRIIKQQETGGTLQKATEVAIGRGRTKSVAQGMQALVSSGLVSTTQAAGLGKKYEEEVGVPARLQAADISQQRLNQALTGKAGFIERREDIGPDFATIAGLAKSIGAGQQATVPTAPATSGLRTIKRVSPAATHPSQRAQARSEAERSARLAATGSYFG